MENKKFKAVFSLRISRELLKAGFKVENVELNREDNNYLVFFFSATPELLNEFEYIKSNLANVC